MKIQPAPPPPIKFRAKTTSGTPAGAERSDLPAQHARGAHAGMLHTRPEDAMVEVEDEDDCHARWDAVYRISKMTPDAAAQHCDVLVGMFNDSNNWVRHRALETFSTLDPAQLAKHAGAVKNVLGGDRCWRMRFASLEIIDKMMAGAAGQVDAAAVADAAAAALGDEFWRVRLRALCILGRLARVPKYAQAVAGMLHDECSEVREQALTTLNTLESPQLARVAGFVVASLRDPNQGVRRKAALLLGRIDSEPLAPHRAPGELGPGGLGPGGGNKKKRTAGAEAALRGKCPRWGGEL